MVALPSEQCRVTDYLTCVRNQQASWPSGQGVGLLIRRLWARVPQGVTFTSPSLGLFSVFLGFFAKSFTRFYKPLARLWRKHFTWCFARFCTMFFIRCLQEVFTRDFYNVFTRDVYKRLVQGVLTMCLQHFHKWCFCNSSTRLLCNLQGVYTICTSAFARFSRNLYKCFWEFFATFVHVLLTCVHSSCSSDCWKVFTRCVHVFLNWGLQHVYMCSSQGF